MQSVLMRALCQIGIFMVCTQTLIHFRPNDSYEKYLKLLVSVMLLVQIFQPLAGILSLGEEVDLTRRVRYFQESMEAQMEQALKHQVQYVSLEELSRQELERRAEERQEDGGVNAEEVAGTSDGLGNAEAAERKKEEAAADMTEQAEGVGITEEGMGITGTSDGGESTQQGTVPQGDEQEEPLEIEVDPVPDITWESP